MSAREEIAQLTERAAVYAEDTSVTERDANLYIATRATPYAKGPDVLVLGAATGCWADPLLERFGRFACVDAVQSMIDALCARYPAVTGHVALFEEFAPAERFDTIIMGHILEHVGDPVAILSRARKWLKPDGVILITVPNARSLHRLVGVAMGMLPSEKAFSPGDIALGHRRVYDRESLAADVKAAGFRCEVLTGLVLKPLSNAQMDGWNDDLRRAYFALGEKLPELACVVFAVARVDR